MHECKDEGRCGITASILTPAAYRNGLNTHQSFPMDGYVS